MSNRQDAHDSVGMVLTTDLLVEVKLICDLRVINTTVKRSNGARPIAQDSMKVMRGQHDRPGRRATGSAMRTGIVSETLHHWGGCPPRYPKIGVAGKRWQEGCGANDARRL